MSGSPLAARPRDESEGVAVSNTVQASAAGSVESAKADGPGERRQHIARRHPTEQPQRAIIASITSLAHALGMDTTAEGVETLDELDVVRMHGCSHVQGFIYERPLDR